MAVPSLLRLSRELSLLEPLSPIQKRHVISISRKCKLLSLLLEDLLRKDDSALPRSALLCFREILSVLQKIRALSVDCSNRSRIRLLLGSEPVNAGFHELISDISTLLDILPDLDVSDDVNDLIALLRRRCRDSSPQISPEEEALRKELLSLISDIENEIVPDRSRLEMIFRDLGLEDSRSCVSEIETLEREIGDRVSEKWIPAMVASVAVVRYGKCVLFGSEDLKPEFDTVKFGFTDPVTTDLAVPADFRCPISLELMKDPVVVATGQTYDRESITRWIASGHATCPKSGQALAHQNLVPNKALKNVISLWCREENIPFNATESLPESNTVTVNKAAVEAARMTATFLVDALVESDGDNAKNRVVHELRQLARSGAEIRMFVGDAGGIPLLIPLMSSSDPDLELNAVTALLNLSIYESNKKRIMHADSAVEEIVRVMSSGTTWRARENAAATVLSLSAVHSYRRRLGRDRSLLTQLVNLVSIGPVSTKKDALDALACLAGERENIKRIIECGAIDVTLDAIENADVADEAVALISSLAKRGGAYNLSGRTGLVTKLIRVLKNGSDTARENAAAALVYLCRKAGEASVVSDLVSVPGIECVIWEMMGTGTERSRKKAASLGRICRRWAETERTAARYSDVGMSVTEMTVAQ